MLIFSIVHMVIEGYSLWFIVGMAVTTSMMMLIGVAFFLMLVKTMPLRIYEAGLTLTGASFVDGWRRRERLVSIENITSVDFYEGGQFFPMYVSVSYIDETFTDEKTYIDIHEQPQGILRLEALHRIAGHLFTDRVRVYMEEEMGEPVAEVFKGPWQQEMPIPERGPTSKGRVLSEPSAEVQEHSVRVTNQLGIICLIPGLITSGVLTILLKVYTGNLPEDTYIAGYTISVLLIVAGSWLLLVAKYGGPLRIYDEGVEWYDVACEYHYLQWEDVTKWMEFDYGSHRTLMLWDGDRRVPGIVDSMPGYYEWIGLVKGRMTQAKKG